MARWIGRGLGQGVGLLDADVSRLAQVGPRTGPLVLGRIDELPGIRPDAGEYGLQGGRGAVIERDAERAREIYESRLRRLLHVGGRHGPARSALELARGGEGAIVVGLHTAARRWRRRQHLEHVGRRSGGQVTGSRSGRRPRDHRQPQGHGPHRLPSAHPAAPSRSESAAARTVVTIRVQLAPRFPGGVMTRNCDIRILAAALVALELGGCQSQPPSRPTWTPRACRPDLGLRP